MREIRFRAWDNKNQRMYYDVGIFPNQCKTPMSISSDGLFYHPLHSQFGKLMQYTGLKDKNGKEIYEGDIIENTSGVITIDVKCEVFFRDYGWHLRKDNGYEFLAFGLERCVIIGNIYENPELLQQ